MNDINEKSSIRLVSNIMRKKEYEKNPQKYLPADLIPNSRDVRMQASLSLLQREQNVKRLFYAKTIIDVEN